MDDVYDFDRSRWFSFLMREVIPPPAITSSHNYNKYVPIYFGLPNKNMTWKLGAFLARDTINKLTLLLNQIEAIHDLVDWDIISTHDLPSEFVIKHKNNINWEVYLKTHHSKNIDVLIKAKDKIHDHQHLFYSIYMNIMYMNISKGIL